MQQTLDIPDTTRGQIKIWRRLVMIATSIIQLGFAAYGLTSFILLVLHLSIGERLPLMRLLNTFLHLSWLPALVLLPVCLLLGWRWLSLLMLPMVLAFGFNYGMRYLPRQITPPPNATQISLLSYNFRIGNPNIDDTLNVIREANADIVAIQELSDPLVERLEAEFAELYPYHQFHVVEIVPGRNPTVRGQGILSRYPIKDSEFWFYDWLPQALGHQRAEISVNGKTMVLYNVHVSHPGLTDNLFNTLYRDREVTDLLARAASETAPVIMAGDFNLSDLSDAYNEITNQLTDAYRVAGFGLGLNHPEFVHGNSYGDIIPGWLPISHLVRLDYVFHSDEWQTLNAKVWHTSGGSDHRPVWLELALTES